jgi:hypothetical protein
MKNLKCNLKISRYTSNNQEPGVTIEVQDEDSRVTLCSLDLTLAQFGEAITGPCIMDVPCESWADDSRLGIKQKTETREVFCPISSYNKEDYVNWLKENVKLTDGEVSSFYLGTQSSVARKDDGAVLRYSVRSWPQHKAAGQAGSANL